MFVFIAKFLAKVIFCTLLFGYFLQQGIQNLDEVWISKLESAKKLHSADLDSLANALDEINQL